MKNSLSKSSADDDFSIFYLEPEIHISRYLIYSFYFVVVH